MLSGSAESREKWGDVTDRNETTERLHRREQRSSVKFESEYRQGENGGRCRET